MNADRDFVSEMLEMETEEARIAFMGALSAAEIAIVERQLQERMDAALLALKPLVSFMTRWGKALLPVLERLNLDP